MSYNTVPERKKGDLKRLHYSYYKTHKIAIDHTKTSLSLQDTGTEIIITKNDKDLSSIIVDTSIVDINKVVDDICKIKPVEVKSIDSDGSSAELYASTVDLMFLLGEYIAVNLLREARSIFKFVDSDGSIVTASSKDIITKGLAYDIKTVECIREPTVLVTTAIGDKKAVKELIRLLKPDAVETMFGNRYTVDEYFIHTF